ncbi:MAG: ATP-binding protein [Phycisphaerales bacterium]|nr:ATP-binding protein [Phycisphaerales bacterium]
MNRTAFAITLVAAGTMTLCAAMLAPGGAFWGLLTACCGVLAVGVGTTGLVRVVQVGTGPSGREERLRSILNSISTAVIAVRGDDVILGLNSAATVLLDLDDADPVGVPLHQAGVPEPVLAFVAAARRTGSCSTAELSIDSDDHQTLIVRSEPLVVDGDGQGMVLVLDDVTRMRRLETMRSDFAANVSHELRTPITAIQGYAELLDESSQGTDKDHAQVILRNCRRLSAIIEDLLALARLEGESQAAFTVEDSVPVHDLLDAVTRSCADEASHASITMRVDCNDQLAVQGSTALLEQAVSNLVTNAIRYGGSGSMVELRATQAGDAAEIAVVDHGGGIPLEHHSRVFERFYRIDRGRSRQVGGTGLGLAIVKNIVLAHKGSVALKETPGGGCTFVMSLPAV